MLRRSKTILKKSKDTHYKYGDSAIQEQINIEIFKNRKPFKVRVSERILMSTNIKKKMLHNLPDVMDVRQMSDFLGISSKKGYKLLKEGTIAHLQIGRSLKVPKLHLVTYLNSCGDRSNQ